MSSENSVLSALEKLRTINFMSMVPHELPHRELMTLKVIMCENQGKGVKATALSDRMGTSKPAISHILNSLESAQLIKRTMDKKDRRVVYVELTENGKKVVDRTHRVMIDFLSQITEKLGEDDSQKLASILNRLYEILAEMKNEANAF